MRKSGKPDPTPTRDRPQTPGVGRTEQARGDDVEPRLPHERDESSDSQDMQAPGAAEPWNKAIGEQAFEDLRQGRQDTGRLPVTDKVYEGLKKPGAADKSKRRG